MVGGRHSLFGGCRPYAVVRKVRTPWWARPVRRGGNGPYAVVGTARTPWWVRPGFQE
ncbi:hypothetical protein [Streptomyces sp. 2224.1]|uniref:hypothetical protein n=1 Tax=Streptomyces sp. 2224.1 TaxID=1881020 RepID=UPI00159FAD88|nr:hypothetical protein [Streptomyces sp. 2224.1]